MERVSKAKGQRSKGKRGGKEEKEQRNEVLEEKRGEGCTDGGAHGCDGC